MSRVLARGRYLTFILQRIRMLRSHGVEPLMVFDGCAMPAKKGTNDERGRLRAQHHARGMAHAQDGNRSAATDCFQAAIRITPDMTRQLQEKLREAGALLTASPVQSANNLCKFAPVGR
jgi:exonuclease 1